MIPIFRSGKLSAMPYPALLAERTGLLSSAMGCRDAAQVHAYADQIAVYNAEVRLRARQSGVRRPIRGL